jgi:hypothetical protein
VRLKIDPKTPICSFSDGQSPLTRSVTTASKEAQSIVNDICKNMSVASDKFIIQAANVANAEALIISGKRLIYYSPFFIDKIQKESQTYWSMIFVMAHEMLGF